MFLKQIFLLLLISFKKYYCDYQNYYTELSRNFWPYQYYQIGPFWTYPVKIGKSFNGRLFKRDAPETQEDYLYKLNIPTKPNYKNVGSWAKGKTPVKEVNLDWMPLQIYSQVRKTNTVKHLPQDSAVQEANTPEELLNAPRLKEVVSHKKIQQVYEEEGFEDSGYNHGGYNHHGANYADISRKEAAELIKDEKPPMHRESPSESVKIFNIANETISNYPSTKVNHDSQDNYQEARIISIGDNPPFHLRTDFINKFNSEQPKKFYLPSGERNIFKIRPHPVKEDQSSEISDNEKVSRKKSPVVFPGRTTKRNYVNNNSTPLWSSISAHRIPVKKKDKRPRFRYHPSVQAHLDTLGQHIVSSISENLKPFVTSTEKYSAQFISDVPEQNRTSEEDSLEELNKDQYGNGADTLAAYATLAKQNISSINGKADRNRKSKPNYNNITRIIYTRYDNGKVENSGSEWLPFSTSLNIRHPSMPSDSQELYEYEVLSVNGEPSVVSLSGTPKIHLNSNDTTKAVKYIEQLTIAHFSSPMNNKISQVTPENKKNRLKDLAKALNTPQETVNVVDKTIIRLKRESTPKNYNRSQYPFYDKEHSISKDSALKYASNPAFRPDKTKGGMVFYEQKDKLIQCDDPETPEDITPEHFKDGEWNRKPYPENLPRIKGLGDKIQCFKKKYFGENPLDNPFFQEKLIGNITGFELDSEIKKYLSKKGVLSKNPNERVMVVPESEERTSDNGFGIVSNHRNIFDGGLPHRNHKPETKSHYLRNKIPFKYQSEPSKQYSTYEKPEEDVSDSIKQETKKKRKRPYHYVYRKKKHPKKRKRYGPRPYPVSIYSVINGHYYPNQYQPIVYAHSKKNYRVIPVYEKNTQDSIASDSQNSYKVKPEKYYVIRPGEYTHNKDLLKNKDSSGIWNYMNPLKWWFPNLFDSRRKEPKYRAKRELSPKYGNPLLMNMTLNEDLQLIPKNHKPETTTTGKPITLEEFKKRFNITDKQKNPVQFDMLTGGFLNAQSSTTVPQETLATIPPSIETTTRSTIGTSKKPRVLFPRTVNPKLKSNQSKQITENRGDKKFMTTTSTTPRPNSSTRRPFPSRRLSNFYKNKNITTSTTEIPTSTETEENNYENPRRLQKVEHRRVTEEEVIKTTYLPEEDTKGSQEIDLQEQEVTDPGNVEDERINNGTLTYLVNPSTGNGSWEYVKKKKRKQKNREFKKQNKLKSDGKNDKFMDTNQNRRTENETDQYKKHIFSTPENGNEAYIIGLMSKVPPIDVDRKRYIRRKQLQATLSTSAHAQTKNGYVPPTFNTKIPLKFILQPNKRKYYYVVNT